MCSLQLCRFYLQLCLIVWFIRLIRFIRDTRFAIFDIQLLPNTSIWMRVSDEWPWGHLRCRSLPDNFLVEIFWPRCLAFQTSWMMPIANKNHCIENSVKMPIPRKLLPPKNADDQWINDTKLHWTRTFDYEIFVVLQFAGAKLCEIITRVFVVSCSTCRTALHPPCDNHPHPPISFNFITQFIVCMIALVYVGAEWIIDRFYEFSNFLPNE